jgi:hypothetical protein
MTDTAQRAELLAADDWRPLSEYVPSRDYVYARGFGLDTWNPGVNIARRGKHPMSDWWTPAGRTVSIDVKEWKPFADDGVSPHDRWIAFRSDPNEGKFVRPPEPVYEPGSTDVRLTPVPRLLLTNMRDGARLRERAWRWTEWTLHWAAAGMPHHVSKYAINALTKVAFIQRDGVLPPGRIPEWLEFTWSVADAGKEWLEANAKPAASAAQPQETT